MIAPHGPTLRLPDREGVINYFILSRIAGSFGDAWTTHGIIVSVIRVPGAPVNCAAVLYRRNEHIRAVSIHPDQPATIPELLAMLEGRCLAAGVRAEHLTGEEAWPK